MDVAANMVNLSAPGRLPYSASLHVLSQALVITALTIHLTHLLRFLLFLPITLITFHIVFKSTTGDLITDVGVGPAVLTQFLCAVDYILVSDAHKEFRRKGKEDEEVEKKGLKERVLWALDLYFSSRGVGWTHEPAYLPQQPTQKPKSTTARSAFLQRKLVQMPICVLLEVFAYLQNASNPAFTAARSLNEASYFWRSMGMLGFAAAAYARINFMHCVAACVAVSTRLSGPEDWPDLFGSLTEAWMVQRFWRRTWHQLLRRSATSTASFLVNKILRRERGTLSSSLLYLFTLFSISALIHGGGEYMMLPGSGSGAFKFFMLQAIAIALEKLVKYSFNISSARLEQPPMLFKILGYIWVWSWFVWSMPVFLDPMIRAGLFVDKRGKNLGRVIEMMTEQR